MRLKDKVVVIAGAGSGIGRAAALLFAQEGAQVILLARRAEVLAETQKAVEARGASVLSFSVDLNQSDAVKKTFAAIAEKFGRIDVVYCNMGGYARAPIEKISDGDWDALIDANLRTTFIVAREAAEHLARRPRSSLILTAAVFGHALHPQQMAHYNASKAGVLSLAKTLALELSSKNIRVNCICPGAVSHRLFTPENQPLATDPRLSRGGLPEDVAYAALYLASDESAWVTGSTLVVDGGASIGVAS